MKTFTFITALLFVSFVAFSQNEPAPEYLVQQDFPDSVKQVPLTQLGGEEIPFSEMIDKYKGKKVVIDYWASWCKDCVGGLPKVKDLQNITKDLDVVYVFLSIDKEEEKWKAAIDKFNIKGEHYWIKEGWKNPFSNYIVTDWIPRYLLINEEGRITMSKVIRATDPKMLNAILDKNL